MLPPRRLAKPAACRIACVIAAVVDLPLLPVTPMVRLRLNCQKSDISLVKRRPLRGLASGMDLSAAPRD